MTQPSQRDLRGLRVLVVEDEFFIADDLAKELRDAGAEPVGPVATVEEAERRIAAGGIDAAILDMNLRGEKAFRLVEHMARESVPCVIVSGYSGDALPDHIARLPRLEKPIAAAKVLETLKGQLRE